MPLIGYFHRILTGYRLTGPVFSEFNTLNFLECSLYCLRKPSDCKSINYKSRKHQRYSINCQLIKATKTTHPQNWLPDENFDYYEPLKKVYFYTFSAIIKKQDTWAGVNLHCRVANLRKVAWEVFGNSYRAFNR